MVRDARMQELVRRETITPLIDRVRELARELGVSTVLVTGGGGDYLDVADTVVLGLAWLDVYPFDMLPDIAWAAVILTTFAASAFLQTYQSQRMRFGDEGPPPELT